MQCRYDISVYNGCCWVEGEDPITLEKKVSGLHMHLHYSVPSGSLDLGNFVSIQIQK